MQVEITVEIERIIEDLKIVDWTDNRDVRNQMWGKIEDYLYQVGEEHSLDISAEVMDEMIGQVIEIARKRS